MKKLMLMALIALNAVWTSDKLFAMDPPLAESSDGEKQLEDDEIPASQTRRRASSKKKKKKRDLKAEKPTQSDDTCASLLEILVDTGEEAYNFEQTHQDEIVSGVKTAIAIVQTVGGAADSVIGDGDGKLSPAEILDFLKKIGDALGNLKDFITSAFKKDEPLYPDISSNILSEPVRRNKQTRNPLQIVGKAAEEAKESLETLQELLKNKIACKLIELEDFGDLTDFEQTTVQMIRIFIEGHSDLQASIGHLLDRLNGKHMRALPDKDIKTINDFVDSFIAAQACLEDSSGIVPENNQSEVPENSEGNNHKIISGVEIKIAIPENTDIQVTGDGESKTMRTEGTNLFQKIGNVFTIAKNKITGLSKKEKSADKKIKPATGVIRKKRSTRRIVRKKKQDTSSDNKELRNIDGSTLGTLVSTGKQGIDFVVGHKDEIIQGAHIAENIADKVIGDGDGKLSLDEVVVFFKKIGGALGTVKDHIPDAFKKDKPADDQASTHANDSGSSLFGQNDEAANNARENLELLKSLLEGEIACRLIKLENTGVQAVDIFIQSHSDVKRAVQYLLDRLNGKRMRGLPDKDIETINKFAESFIAAQDSTDDFNEMVFIDNQDEVQGKEPVSLKPKKRRQPAQGFIQDNKKDMQEAPGLFEQLISYQDADKKLTVNDIPNILKTLIKKINKAKKLIGRLSSKKKESPKRSFNRNSVDSAAMKEVESSLIGIGKKLTQLSTALRVSPEELQKVIKHMNVEELHRYLNEGDDEVIPLDAQLHKYVAICTPHRAPIDLQVLGETLEFTLKLAVNLQDICIAIDVIAKTSPETRYSRWLSMLDSKGLFIGLGVTITTLTALLGAGEQVGWWDIYSS